MARGHCGTCRGTSWSDPHCKDRVRSPPRGVTWGRPWLVPGSFSRSWWTVFPGSHLYILFGARSGVETPVLTPDSLIRFLYAPHIRLIRQTVIQKRRMHCICPITCHVERMHRMHNLCEGANDRLSLVRIRLFRFFCACLDAARIAEPLGRFEQTTRRTHCCSPIAAREHVIRADLCCAPPRHAVCPA